MANYQVYDKKCVIDSIYEILLNMVPNNKDAGYRFMEDVRLNKALYSNDIDAHDIMIFWRKASSMH